MSINVQMYSVPLLCLSILISGPPYFKNNSIEESITENKTSITIDFGLIPLLFPVSSKVILEKEGLAAPIPENSWDISIINRSVLFFEQITRHHAGQYTLTLTYYHNQNKSQEVGTSVAKLTLNVMCK